MLEIFQLGDESGLVYKTRFFLLSAVMQDCFLDCFDSVIMSHVHEMVVWHLAIQLIEGFLDSFLYIFELEAEFWFEHGYPRVWI